MANINIFSPRSGRMIRENGTIVNVADGYNDDGVQNVHVIGSKVEEQLTEVDASGGTLTFSQNIKEIGIYNTDTTDGTFNVNGIDIHVPAGEYFEAQIGGTPSPSITITGSTKFIVTRYE